MHTFKVFSNLVPVNSSLVLNDNIHQQYLVFEKAVVALLG